MSKILFLAISLCVVFPFVLSAQQQHHSPSDVKHDYSITIAPFKLVLPLVEGTFETRMMDKIGIQGIAGAGSYNGFFIFSLGGMWKYYLIGSYEHALQLAAEVYYLHIHSGNVDGSNISGGAGGLFLGPLIGYKYIADYGLTLDFTFGVGPYFLSATATDNNNSQNSATASGTVILPMINLNAGWSF